MKYTMVLGCILLLASLLDKNDAQDLKKNTTQTEQTSTKQKAFIVLRNNCNTCHATKRQLQLFTLYNMDSLRLEINTQVFITRKIPTLSARFHGAFAMSWREMPELRVPQHCTDDGQSELSQRCIRKLLPHQQFN